MSKTFIIAASVAGASAMAAPRIELDLSAMSNTVSKDDLANTALYKNLIATHTTGSYVSGHHDSSTTATYDATGTATGTKNIGSRQDWTEQCAAATATTANCPTSSATTSSRTSAPRTSSSTTRPTPPATAPSRSSSP
jgi:hypothetical protein